MAEELGMGMAEAAGWVSKEHGQNNGRLQAPVAVRIDR